MTISQNALLEISDLVTTFGTGDVATSGFPGLSLYLAKGEKAALLVPAGSGKSTLSPTAWTLLTTQ